MRGVIDPEAADPSTTQEFGFGERNSTVPHFGGGQVPAPAASESGTTETGPAVSPDAGVKE